MKRIIWTCLAVLLATLLAGRPAAYGQSEPQVAVNEVEVMFPDGVVFKLAATSPSRIEQVDLYYGTSGRTCQVGEARQAFDFEPGTEVSLDWEWEWKRSGILPPGSEIWWEWELTYESGAVMRLPRETVTVEDHRNEWQVIDEANIVLRWYVGDAQFGRDLHTIAVESLGHQSQTMGIGPDSVIHMTIYPTGDALREALLVSAEWTGGVALPDHNSLIIAIAPNEMSWARSVIPHELNHLLVRTLFFNCRGAFMPTWLSEGLAEYAEDPEGSGVSTLTAQLGDDSLPALRALASGFSAFGDSARLAYLQSKHVVTFMYREYGQEKVLALLDTLKSGESIDDSLEAVYGFDTDGLDRAWRESLGFTSPEGADDAPDEAAATPTPIATLPLMTLGLAPTPTATALPPTPAPPTEAGQEESPPTEAPAAATPTPLPGPPAPPEQGGTSLPVYLLAGAGVLVLIALLIYYQFFRR